jgi:hypothetical protein
LSAKRLAAPNQKLWCEADFADFATDCYGKGFATL